MEISLTYLIFYIQLAYFTFKLNLLFYLLSAFSLKVQICTLLLELAYNIFSGFFGLVHKLLKMILDSINAVLFSKYILRTYEQVDNTQKS